MARKRTLHPGFFLNHDLFEAEQRTGLPIRLAFAGLWCHADREGRFAWKPHQMKPGILPWDAVDFGKVLDVLAEIGQVMRYEVDGKVYGWIPTMREYQRFHPNEAKSQLPAPPDDAGGEVRAPKGEPKVPPRSTNGSPKGHHGGAMSAGESGPSVVSGPSDAQALQDLRSSGEPEARLRAMLGDLVADQLTIVLRESGRGRQGAVLAMLRMLNPEDGANGPGGRPVTPVEMAHAVGALAGAPNPAWHPSFACKMILAFRSGGSRHQAAIAAPRAAAIGTPSTRVLVRDL